MYAYARGIRSSRAIERACVEDVAYRVIAANRAPDHSTIAEFRVRHEQALAELFGGVLQLCKQAGLVSVGVIAVDGTKVVANASSYANADYQRIAMETLDEAARIDREEDELYGDARGDELPEHLRTPEGRRAALKAAKDKLDEKRQRREREQPQSSEPLPVREPTAPAVMRTRARCSVLRLEARRSLPSGTAGRGWLRAARHQLDRHREHNQCRFGSHGSSGCWRQSGAWRKTSRSSIRRTGSMSLASGRGAEDGSGSAPTKPCPAGRAGGEDQPDRSRLPAAEGQPGMGAGLQRASGRQRAPDRARGRDHG